MKKTSRQILAANLARLMAISPQLKSQPAVGRAAGIAASHVGRALRQDSAITLDALDALARAFGCEAWELLADGEHTREEAIRRMLLPAPLASLATAQTPGRAKPTPEELRILGLFRRMPLSGQKTLIAVARQMQAAGHSALEPEAGDGVADTP